MRNAHSWFPSKYINESGLLRASTDRQHLAIESRIVADLVARSYDGFLRHRAMGNLLDIGCGLVPLYGTYSKLADTVTTADWPSSYHDSRFVDIFLDLGAELPFKSESFNTILASDVLEHLQNPALFWRSSARVLRTGGLLVGNVPFLYPIHEQPHDYTRFTEYSLRLSMREHGFDDIVIVNIGGYVECVANLLVKGMVQFGLPGRVGASVSSRLIALWTNSAIGARLKSRTGQKFPLGYLFSGIKK